MCRGTRGRRIYGAGVHCVALRQRIGDKFTHPRGAEVAAEAVGEKPTVGRHSRRVPGRALAHQPGQLVADRHEPLFAALTVHGELSSAPGDEHVAGVDLGDLGAP